MKPGICSPEEITYDKGKMYDRIIDFIGPKVKQPVGDVGELNHKSQTLARRYGVEIEQIESIDFDFAYLGSRRYETIFCFEVLSHLVNPGWFMWQLKGKLEKGGVLYLSMPSRPRVLWNKRHYNEIRQDRFEAFIINEMGLKIVRRRKIRNSQYPFPWTTYVGIRPVLRAILRLFYNFTIIYEIRHEKEN